MKKITIGTQVGTQSNEPAQPATLDLERLLETRMLIQANSGGGKSYAIRKLLEASAGQVQQIVIDMEGEFATLREKHDYIIASPHGGDTLAHPKTAKILARRLLETGVSAILDVYELKAHERQSFVKLFLEEMINAPKSLWHPVLLVLDEAHVFCPEGGKSESGGAVIDMATRGRKRGFCLVAATQRLSKLHKDCAAELLNKLIGRTGLDVDTKRAADELGMGLRGAVELLRNMKPGEFCLFGPAAGQEIELIRIGKVETTHPKAGSRLLKAPPAPTAAIKAILPKLADLQKEAETELRTVEDLRKELANVRRELTNAQRGTVAPSLTVAQMDEEYKRGYREAEVNYRKHADAEYYRRSKPYRDELRAALNALQSQSQKCLNALDADLKTIAVADMIVEEAWNKAPQATVKKASADQARESRLGTNMLAAARPKREGASEADEAVLTSPERRVLNALAWLEDTTGKPAQEVAALASMADYAPTTSTFGIIRAKLKGKGLVEYTGDGRTQLTDEGRALAEWPTKAGSAQDLHERIYAKLSGPERRVLEPLIEVYPEPLPMPLLAARAGYELTTSTFGILRARLKTLGFVEYPSQGLTLASSALFPGAHR